LNQAATGCILVPSDKQPGEHGTLHGIISLQTFTLVTPLFTLSFKITLFCPAIFCKRRKIHTTTQAATTQNLLKYAAIWPRYVASLPLALASIVLLPCCSLSLPEAGRSSLLALQDASGNSNHMTDTTKPKAIEGPNFSVVAA